MITPTQRRQNAERLVSLFYVNRAMGIFVLNVTLIIRVFKYMNMKVIVVTRK